MSRLGSLLPSNTREYSERIFFRKGVGNGEAETRVEKFWLFSPVYRRRDSTPSSRDVMTMIAALLGIYIQYLALSLWQTGSIVKNLTVGE